MADARPTHLSLQRAVAILRVFTEGEPSLTVSEIARRLGLHKSTVSRILATLLDEGLVWHDRTSGRYALGLGLVEMAGVALGQIDVRAASIEHIERLLVAVDETVTVSVRRGTDAITVAHVSPVRSVRQVAWIGRRIPLATTATGKVFLAALLAAGDDWRRHLPTSASPSAMHTELRAVLEDGYAVEVDEFEAGTCSIAAPVRDRNGAVLAAVAIGAPTARFGHDERQAALPALLGAARDIARDMGLSVGEAV